MTNKTYFNDSRPYPNMVTIECCDCRNTIEVQITERYPHGPDTINYCPVCGNKDISRG